MAVVAATTTTLSSITAMDVLDWQALQELAVTRNEQQYYQHDEEDKPERRLSTGSCSTQSTSSSTFSTRRVQFQLDHAIHVIPVSFETEEEKEALWYCKADISAATKMEKESVQEYVQNTCNRLPRT
jgi:hypothetical protein